MAKVKFEMLEHTSEVKFRVYGKSIEEIFENSSLAFSDFIGRGKRIKSDKKKASAIESGDESFETLLHLFLDEMIYLLDAENFVVSKCKAKMKSGRLEVVFQGDSAKNYSELDHVKAATYSEIYVKQKKDKSWEAQFVLDV